MAVETEEDLAVFFNPDEFGTAASYTPPGGGSSTPCTLLKSSQDRQAAGTFGRPILKGDVIAVRKSELAAPAAGGTFVITGTGENLVIQGDPETDDEDRKVWNCTVK
jgi:hypothetical protein